MTQDRVIRTLLGLSTAVLIFAALHYARSILAPVVFSLFIIAIVWPLQSRLQARVPKLLALAITVLATLMVITLLASLLVWGFSRIGQWLISNAAAFKCFTCRRPLAGQPRHFHCGPNCRSFNMSWLIRAVQGVGGRLHGFISFAIVTLVFAVLGLLEVDVARRNIARLKSKEMAQSLLQAGTDIAVKFQKYMLVRSVMSVLTGAVVWGVTLLAGLELATAWGVIAFVLNYIPFLGPLFATVFPTLFAIAQFESWQLALIVFLCLNLIQFLIGSYFEPRIAGAALAVSPFLILFAVFFWSFLWGIPGAFIGVPIVIALLTVCEQHESTRWVPMLLSGRDDKPA